MYNKFKRLTKKQKQSHTPFQNSQDPNKIANKIKSDQVCMKISHSLEKNNESSQSDALFKINLKYLINTKSNHL